jgi:hypothetical protein
MDHAGRLDASQTTGTGTGLTALAVEGDPLDLFEPETPGQAGGPGSGPAEEVV